MTSPITVVGGVCAAVAILLSTYLIYMHHRNWHSYSMQSKIVGIIWLVPIYSFDSFIGLALPSVGVTVNLLRDCYESYVLYLFLSLLLAYLGLDAGDEDDEFDVLTYLETGPRPRFPPPFSYLWPLPLPAGRSFLLFTKRAVLQNCLLKPGLTFMVIMYPDSSVLSVLASVAINASILYTIAVLCAFYCALRPRLAPFAPVPKFLALKAVLFFTFWQSVLIAMAGDLSLLPDIRNGSGKVYSQQESSIVLQNTLVCIEMVALSIAHLYIYDWRPFSATSSGPRQQLYIGLAAWGEEATGERKQVPSGGAIVESIRVRSLSGSSSSSMRQSLLERGAQLQQHQQEQEQEQEEEEVVFYPKRDASTPHAKGGGLDSPAAKGWVQVLPSAASTSTTISSTAPPAKPGFWDANFAASSAINDLNVSGLLGRVLLPVAFKAERGTVVGSSALEAGAGGGGVGASSSGENERTTSLSQFFAGGGGWGSSGGALAKGSAVRKAEPEINL